MEGNGKVRNITMRMKGNFPKEVVVEACTDGELSRELLVQAYYDALYQLYAEEYGQGRDEEEIKDCLLEEFEEEEEEEPGFTIEAEQDGNMVVFRKVLRS